MKNQFLLGMIITLIATTSLFGQRSTGVLNGGIYDKDGRPVSYATVSITAIHVHKSADHDGHFEFNQLSPGTYQLEVSAVGYQTKHKTVTVKAGSTTMVNIICRPSNVELQEVVVTAEKQNQRLEEASLPVTNISSDEIEHFGLQHTEDLSGFVPNLQFINVGSATHSFISIRGINAYSPEPPVAVYVNGVNQFDMTSLNNSLFGVERVEILRGPQSTLFGRNTMGGVINIITKKSTNISHGFAVVGIGDYGSSQYRAGYRGPLVRNKLFLNVSGQYNRRDGYFRNRYTSNVFDDKENVTGNMSVRYRPGNNWDITYSSNIQYNDEKGVFPFAINDSLAFAHPYTTNQNRSSGTERLVWNNALSLQHVGEQMDFTSVTSYQHVNRTFKDTLDRDYTPYDLNAFIAKGHGNSVPIHAFTEELRLSSPSGKASPFQWMAGIYLFSKHKEENYTQLTGEDARTMQGDTLAPYINTTYSDEQNYGISFWGQATYALTPVFEITAGLRYDYEHRSNLIKAGFIKGPAPEQITFPETKREADFTAFSPKLALTYTFSPQLNTYLSYSRGFRAGGINPYTTNEAYQEYDPSFSDNFEWGTKARLAGNRLSIRTALFFINWKDQQVNTLVPGQGFQMGILNAGQVHSKGAELEVSVKPIKYMTASYSAAYTDATFRELPLPDMRTGEVTNYKGNRQIFTPRFSSRLGLQYHYPFHIGNVEIHGLLNGFWKYTGRQYFDLLNTIEQEPYHLLNLQAGLGTKHFEIKVWCKNLSETKYLAFAFPFGGTYSLLGPPRTWGLTLKSKF